MCAQRLLRLGQRLVTVVARSGKLGRPVCELLPQGIRVGPEVIVLGAQLAPICDCLRVRRGGGRGVGARLAAGRLQGLSLAVHGGLEGADAPRRTRLGGAQGVGRLLPRDGQRLFSGYAALACVSDDRIWRRLCGCVHASAGRLALSRLLFLECLARLADGIELLGELRREILEARHLRIGSI